MNESLSPSAAVHAIAPNQHTPPAAPRWSARPGLAAGSPTRGTLPVTFGTTEAFLVQFGLESVNHLPGVDELKAAGFLEAIPPSGFEVPNPTDVLGPDEEPYVEEDDDLATGGPDLD